LDDDWFLFGYCVVQESGSVDVRCLSEEETESAVARAAVALSGMRLGSGATVRQVVEGLRCAREEARSCAVRCELLQQEARAIMSVGRLAEGARLLAQAVRLQGGAGSSARVPPEIVAEIRTVVPDEDVSEAAAATPQAWAGLVRDAALLATAQGRWKEACDAAHASLALRGGDASDAAAVATLVEATLRAGQPAAARELLVRFVMYDPARRLRAANVATLSTLAELTLSPHGVRQFKDGLRWVATHFHVDLPPQ